MELVNETVADFYLARMYDTGDSIRSLVNLMNVRAHIFKQDPQCHPVLVWLLLFA